MTAAAMYNVWTQDVHVNYSDSAFNYPWAEKIVISFQAE